MPDDPGTEPSEDVLPREERSEQTHPHEADPHSAALEFIFKVMC